jgi:glycosyl transferase family 25
MKMFVINLDRRPDRLRSFRENNTIANIERYSAYDSTKMDFPDQNQISKGAMALIMSNLDIYKNLPNESCLTIFEDDAIIRNDFVAQASSQIAQLPNDWHMILWGWNFDCYLVFDPTNGVTPCVAYFSERDFLDNSDQFSSVTTPVQLYKLYRSHGTPGYTISQLGIKCLKDDLARFEFPLDIAFTKKYPELNAYVAFPPLVAAKNCSLSSDINNSNVASGQ